MKEAKTEAEQAIAAYRAEMEAEHERNVSKVKLLCLRFICSHCLYCGYRDLPLPLPLGLN